MVDHCVAPHLHQCGFVQVKLWNPSAGRLLQSSARNQDVKVTVEFQVSSERVLNDHDQHSRSVPHIDPLLDYSGTESGQVVKEVTVLLEDRPEFSRHGENDARVWNVWKNGLLFFQPLERSPIPATGTEPRLTSIEAASFFVG